MTERGLVTDAPAPFPWLDIGTLGMVTVVAYGACYYAFGVLIEPIHADTGWSLAQLGALFSAMLVLIGAVGVVGGRLCDRKGTRPVFLTAGVVGAGSMLAASYQTSFAGFAAFYATGCGLVGALGFYHITQPAAARGHPRDPNRAIVWDHPRCLRKPDLLAAHCQTRSVDRLARDHPHRSS